MPEAVRRRMPEIEPLVPEGWRRHPADLARMVAALIGLTVALGATAWRPDTIAGISEDLLALVEWLPDLLADAATGLGQLLALAGPVVLVGALLLQRRVRLVALLAAAALSAALAAALLQGWLDKQVPGIPTGGGGSWITGSSFPSPAYIAALAAAMTVLGRSLPHRWRRLGAWTIAIAVVLRVVTAVTVPLHVGSTLLLGVAVGSAALVVAGAPSRQARAADLIGSLTRLGVDPTSVRPTPGDDDRFDAQLEDGTPVVVDLVDRDDRDAELFLRLVRVVRVRGIDDESVGWSTARVAEHEALVTLLAAGSARVPQVLGVDVTESGAALLVTHARPLTPLSELADDEIDDDLLEDAWDQVAGLRVRRIAHRSLDRRRLGIDARTGEVVVTRLRRARPAADDVVLAIDVAELLTSLALVVGSERAVRTAVTSLGADAVAGALPVLQPLALSPRTRRELKASGRAAAVLQELRDEIQAATGAQATELLPMQRLSVGRVVSLLGTVFLLYVALAFAANWDAFVDSLGDADWTRLPGIVLLSSVGFVAGALSLMGAVTNRLPLGQTSEVMLAQSFLNRFTPANAGGMALRARYLQINGVDLAVAAASVGLTSAASGVMQALFLVVFLTWSSQGGGLPFSFPDVTTLALIVLVLLVLGGLLWLTPLRHRLLDSKAFASVSEIWDEIRRLATSPSRIVLLFGGAGLGKLFTIVAFAQSTRAFGVDLEFQDLAALYMTANTVASAAPTPGGVGAIEAALIAALTGAGVEPALAFSAVMVFRLVNYWLPVPFAWLALQDLRRKQIV